ncbi:glutathione hydrolase 1 proenzyme-like isoform X1 [Styela clava]
MGPVAKYVKIRDYEGPEDEQSLLELPPPTVLISNGSPSFRKAAISQRRQWQTQCIVHLFFLFILSLIAIGFLIRYLPEQAQVHSHHHHEHTDGSMEEEHHNVFHEAAVAAGQLECSIVGRDIMKVGGNAVDAAIATTLCQGVVEPYYSGIGGGAIMTIYNYTTKSTTCIISREKAPAAATPEMFIGDRNRPRGAKFIAVPGELKGLEYAYNKYGSGKITWNDLFQPSIDKAKNGFEISGSMEQKLKELYEKVIIHDKNSVFCDLYCNDDKTGVKNKGETVKNPLLATTLSKIQQHGIDVFYNGEISDSIVEDIQKLGGIMTKEDLEKYEIVEEPAIEVKLPNAGYTIHAPPLPLGGPVFSAILSIMDMFGTTPEDYKQNMTLQWHRTDEAFRHTYGVRYNMGDPSKVPSSQKIVDEIVSGEFAKSVKGKIFDNKTFHDPKYYGANFLNAGKSSTSHLSVLDPEKNAVAITSTINYHFGAFIMSPTTGIVFNNEMDDFSFPTGDPTHDSQLSPANQIEGGKRPLSSMTPVIISDDKNQDPVFIIGAAGGIRIPTAVAQVMLRLLYFSTDDFDAPIRERRLHDHLVPDVLEYETGYDPEVIKKLKEIGHYVKIMDGESHVNGIKYHTSHIHAFSDLRNEGAGPSGW